MADEKAELLKLVEPYGQTRLLSFWDRISQEEKDALSRQIRALAPAVLKDILAKPAPVAAAGFVLAPEPFKRLPGDQASRAEWEEAREVGRQVLCDGRVAAMVVAGGQGTRLGFDGPKGAFPIGPITERTLFQVHAEKVLAASRRYGREVPLLIMTGPSNDAETRFFFKGHGFFGLPFTTVRIFQQGEMPAVDDAGKIVLDAPGHIFMSPNGHGGSLKALWDSGTVKWLEDRGIEQISYFQVDNPLVRVIDPAFIGFHVASGAEMSLKLLDRSDPDEQLGIWVRSNGRPVVVEYSDMLPGEMDARTGSGGLKYPGGSIAIHCFSVKFIRRLNERGFSLPYHRARKKVPYVDESGRTVHPDKPNATKFEMFVFDALLFAERAMAIETSREEEFSPVKNGQGIDSPDTARRDLSRLYGNWLASIGVDVPRDSGGYPAHPIEISPLVGDDAQSLSRNYRGPRLVAGPLLVAD